MAEKILDLANKHYDPSSLEESIYALWEREGVFSARPDSKKPPYSVVIPPPNVTGRLHMGHALNNTVQDALIRYKRMDGFDALWIPGTDHAGISTQSVVKKQLDAQGINYLELGREKMIERIWEWKKKYGDQILNQLRRIGCSCDWSRTRFTMDEGLSRAVRTAFKKLYDDGLIYRGKYIVNWCPVDRTALSDDEVITTDGGEPGFLWYLRYPLADGSGHVTVATTRPETMLGDAAVAVSPKDARYAQLIGQRVHLPLAGRDIPIIADDYVDKEYGTGCLKVTPAHDPNDFQIGLRHQLPQINVMNEDATMGDGAPQRYHGLDRFDCRKQVVDELNALGLVEKIQEQMTPIGRAQRSKAVIEYRLSDQWFVRMKPLADQALAAGDKQGLRLLPERWDGVYRQWLENTRDWCISRQIWWGHQIPAWYHLQSGEILVDIDTPAQVKSSPSAWRHDTDVLDTWFSSALWPYSTMGWPAETADLARYYPTSLLSTAKDIIYFWVARMVMTAVHFTGKIPFQDVYFHPVICDAHGETMSKSKGNGIDPLHVIAGATMSELEEPIYEARPENLKEMLEYLRKAHPNGFNGVGADALRITLLSLNSQAQQVQLTLEKFEELGQRFITKLFNASKFVMSNLSQAAPGSPAALAAEDEWILGRLDRVVKSARESLERYQFHEMVGALSQFFWDDYCDWYLELSKFRMRNGADAEKLRVQATLAEVLSSVLRLFHPVTPFITEALWQHLTGILNASGLRDVIENARSADLCALASYPKDKGRFNAARDEEFSVMQEVVRAVRNMRAFANIEPNLQVALAVKPRDAASRAMIEGSRELIISMARLKSLRFTEEKPPRTAVSVLERAELYANLAEHMDIGAEITRNEAALKKLDKEVERIGKKLENAGFLEKAPRQIQDEERENLRIAQDKRTRVLDTLKELRSYQS